MTREPLQPPRLPAGAWLVLGVAIAAALSVLCFGLLAAGVR